MRPGAAGAYAPPRHKGVGEYEPYIDCDRRFGLGGVRRVGGPICKGASHIEWPAAHRLRAPARSGRVALRREIPLARLDGPGLPNSPGHYVDLVSAIVGVSLFSEHGPFFVLAVVPIFCGPRCVRVCDRNGGRYFFGYSSPAGAHGTIQTRLCRNLRRCRKCKPPEPREAPENDRLRQSVTVFLAEVEITARRLRTSKIDRLMPIVAGNRRI